VKAFGPTSVARTTRPVNTRKPGQFLEKALAKDKNDYVAHLYLGLTLVRSNDRDRGLAEMETGLNGIHEWLENLTSESGAGYYWDPKKQIRTAIEQGLAGKPTASELVVTAQRVGKQLDEEIERAGWDTKWNRFP
jgi:hypothetical protein